jgi:DinB superfamily
MLTWPDRSEYAEFYASYIARVPDGNVIDFLSTQLGAYRELLGPLSDEAASARPQPGKWNVKEIIGHLCDAERIQSYRALRFARGDRNELQGFEQDDYVREADSGSRSLADLLDEFEAIRKSTVALLGSLPPRVEQRSGVANGAPVTVRAMAYIIAGHTQHHYDSLKERFDRVGA